MNINKFSFSTSWQVSDGQDYLIDPSTKEQYPYNTNKELKGKSGMLTAATPFAHTALGIGNMAIRFFRLLTFYNFWKKDDAVTEYNFKARLIDTGKDAARFVSQPFGIIALEIVAIVGLFKPYDSMKLYCQLEKALYGRPFMAQMIDFVPIKAEDGEEEDKMGYSSSESSTSQSSVIDDVDLETDDEKGTEIPQYQEGERKLSENGSSCEDIPFVPLDKNDLDHIDLDEDDEVEEGGMPGSFDIGDEDIEILPSLEERIEKVLADETNTQPRQKAIKCMQEIAEHVLTTDPDIDNFDEKLDDYIRIAKEAIRREFNPAWVTKDGVLSEIVGNLVPSPAFQKTIDFENVKEALLEKFIEIPAIKDLLARKVDNHLEICDLSDLRQNTEAFYNLSVLVNNFPQLRTEAYEAKEQEIADLYVETFEAMFTAVAKREPNDKINEKLFLLSQLLKQIQNDELHNKVLINLLKNQFDWDRLDAYLSYIGRIPGFQVDEKNMIGALMNTRGSKAGEVTLENFSSKIGNILHFLPKKDPKNHYLEYFRIQIRVVIEDLAGQIHDLLKEKEFNLQVEEDRRLNRNIQDTVAGINDEFGLDIEVEIKMKTEEDPLLAAIESLKVSIPVVFVDVDQDGVDAWLIGKDQTHQLQQFAEWLAKDDYCATLNVLWNDGLEKSIDNLYLRFLQENDDI